MLHRTDEDSSGYRNIYVLSFNSFALAVIFSRNCIFLKKRLSDRSALQNNKCIREQSHRHHLFVQGRVEAQGLIMAPE